MAKAGGRKYARDKNGRFASTGGGGGASKGGSGKAQSTRQKNASTDKRLIDKGMTAVGGRLNKKTASLYAGTKATQRSNADQWTRTGTKSLKRKPGTVGAGTRSGMKANAAQVGKTRNRAASKAGQKPKTGAQAAFASKAAPSAAKQQYRALRSEQRKNQRYSSFASKSDSAKAAGTTRKLNTMVKNRGVSKPKRKGKK